MSFTYPLSDLVKPRGDGYDSDLAWSLGSTNLARWPKGKPVQTWIGIPVCSWGDEIGKKFNYAVREPLPHPYITLAEKCIEPWPEAKRMVQTLVEQIFVLQDIRTLGHQTWSHGGSLAFGTLFGNLPHPWTFVENMIHEAAHQKLRAFGVGFERATHMVKNSPEETFPSPVRDYPRPMPAIVQTLYSFTHVAEFQKRTNGIDPRTAGFVRHTLDTAMGALNTDEPGFFEVLFDWSGGLCASTKN